MILSCDIFRGQTFYCKFKTESAGLEHKEADLDLLLMVDTDPNLFRTVSGFVFRFTLLCKTVKYK